MQFASRRDGRPLYKQPAAAAPEDGWTERLDGDAIVSLSPVSFVGSVLGRLARAMAARARFSLDRFSDVYLVTDALAAHAGRGGERAADRVRARHRHAAPRADDRALPPGRELGDHRR